MKNLVALMCLFIAVNAFAQKRNATKGSALPSYIKVEKGAVQTNPNKRTSFDDILLQDSSGFYGYSSSIRLFSGVTLYMNHFDANMNLKKQVEVEFVYKDKDLDLMDINAVQGVIYAFLSYYNEKEKKTYFFVQRISKTTLQPDGELQKVAELDAVGRRNRGEFSIGISKDESKILIYGKEPKTRRDAKEEGETFSVTVLDSRAKLLWNKSITLPYTDKLYSGKSVKIDNDGNVFLLGTLYKDKVKEKNREGNPNYDEIILFYTENGTKGDEYRIDLKDKFITDLSIMPTNKGEIVCTGLYADKLKLSTPLKGIFFLRANAFSKSVEAESYKEFDKEILEQFAVGSGLFKKKGLYDFDLRDIVLRSDGGAVLLAEQFYIRQVTTSSKNGSTTTYYYYYNNILAVNINPNGTIDWVTNVPKYQVSANDGGRYSSYASMITNGKIYLMYNDNPKNLTVKSGKIKQSNSAIVTLVEINSDGTWNKYPLYSNKDNKTITRPKVSEQVGKNQLILEADRRKKYNFTRVTINK